MLHDKIYPCIVYVGHKLKVNGVTFSHINSRGLFPTQISFNTDDVMSKRTATDIRQYLTTVSWLPFWPIHSILCTMFLSIGS